MNILSKLKTHGFVVFLCTCLGVMSYFMYDMHNTIKQQAFDISVLQEEKASKAFLYKALNAILIDYGRLKEKLTQLQRQINTINDAVRVYDPVTGKPHKPLNPHYERPIKSNNKPVIRVYPPVTEADVYCPKQEGSLFKCPPGVRVK